MNQDGDLLAQLFQHPGFKVLEQRVNAELDRRRNLLVTAITRTVVPIDQGAVDRHRGIMEGIDLFLKEAKRGAVAFQRKGGDNA